MAKRINQRAQLRKELNLTQEDMAMFLGIDRPQLAHYESGLRNLPTPALERLAMITILLVSPDFTNTIPQTEIQKHQTTEMLNKFLKENKYRQMKLYRKIALMEEKNEATQKMLQLIPLLAKADLEKSMHPSVLPILKQKADKALQKNSSHDLLKLKIELNVLQQEAVMISGFSK